MPSIFSEVRCVAEMSVLRFFFKRCLLTAISMEFLPKRSIAYTSTISHVTGFSLSDNKLLKCGALVVLACHGAVDIGIDDL